MYIRCFFTMPLQSHPKYFSIDQNVRVKIVKYYLLTICNMLFVFIIPLENMTALNFFYKRLHGTLKFYIFLRKKKADDIGPTYI